MKEWSKMSIGVDIERDDSESEGQHQIYKKKKKFAVSLNGICDDTPETEIIIVDEKGGLFECSKNFA